MHFRRRLIAASITISLVLLTLVSYRATEARVANTLPVHIPLIASDFCGSFYDTFDNPLSGWFIGQREALNAEIINGEYRLAFSGAGAVWMIAGPMCERRTYHAAVNSRWVGTPGNFIGLLFEADEANNNAFIFAVNTDNRVWLVSEVRNGFISMLIPPTGNDAVLPGNAINRLAVERENDLITLHINDTPVGELRGVDWDSFVLAGVVAASYTNQAAADARFDEFVYNPPQFK